MATSKLRFVRICYHASALPLEKVARMHHAFQQLQELVKARNYARPAAA